MANKKPANLFVQREEIEIFILSKQELAPSWDDIGLAISDFGFLNPIFEIRHPQFSAGLSRLHRACPSVFLDKHFIKERCKYKAKQGTIKIVDRTAGGKIKTVERSA